ncbi:MAG: RidA/YER057c/UK114 superfamily, group 1, partial [uncultured Rubrobacteraceae bacterium]
EGRGEARRTRARIAGAGADPAGARAAFRVGAGPRRQGLRLGTHPPEPRRLRRGAARQGRRGGLRGAGLRGGAAGSALHARRPQAGARRPRPGRSMAEGLRDGQLRARLRPAARRHQRVLRPDPGPLRPRSRGPCPLRGRDGGTPARGPGRDRGRGRANRKL